MSESIIDRTQAQSRADRIRVLRGELDTLESEGILALSPDQRARFDQWAESTLRDLTSRFDVDTSVGEKQMSWGLKIASTLGGLAFCAAAILFALRFWGYLTPPAQVTAAAALPLLGLAGTEFAARREKTLYFAGLLALASLGAFIANLSILGSVYNIQPTPSAMLAWGLFCLFLAYRYGLRPMLVIGLGLISAWIAATFRVQAGLNWEEFLEEPEVLATAGLALFAVSMGPRHGRHTDFPGVYRFLGALLFFIPVFVLAAAGELSYLPWGIETVRAVYGIAGLAASAALVWLGIRRGWTLPVNTGAVAFVAFLFLRLHRWWWDWMPKYLFFAAVGAVAIGLVLLFRRIRSGMKVREAA
ncbi:MAG: DUF2157 domain-containing protein [Candidatus Solibacter usitatus]|nr:DUF2157 domain-containing protein [Candidatus Solibacter usitatus]